jgi:eukaryotic-like serine/threonine-protein kinase
MSSERTTIDTLIRAAARAPSVTSGEAMREVQIGQVIGGYRVEEELGRGGMGVVYRATDLTLDRQVALKVMLAERWPADARPHLLEVFEREARATAKLSHPAIVSLHHIGDDRGLLYLVLELLRGETLQTRIERAPPTPQQAVDVVEQILIGLVYAHEQGILHRDLKPQNVFVCEDGRVRLLDFGLASLQNRVADQSAAAMSRGGTPSYMAPEQWVGGAQDARTDIWAVGMILYRMLSHASIVPPRSVEALRDGLVVAELEPALAAVLQRATRYDASGRFATAREMLDELRAAMGRSALTLPGPTARRGRRPAIARIALALAAAAALGGATWGWRRGRAPAQLPLAALPGSYRGPFDQLLLRLRPDGALWGAYAHDQGFLQARFRDGVLAGWWCEEPSRAPPHDAGEFEMRVSRDEHGDVYLDGRYRYGRAGQWDENWNLTATPERLDELAPRLEVTAPPCQPSPPR